MRGTPEITDSHIPRTVVELPHLSNIHPAPVFADLDLVMGTNLDSLATLRKGVDLSRADNPFADPFALVRPYGDTHRIIPVIHDFQEATGFITMVFRRSGRWLGGKLRPTGRELYLNLRHGTERYAKQDSQHTIPSDPLARHLCSFERSGEFVPAPVLLYLTFQPNYISFHLRIPVDMASLWITLSGPKAGARYERRLWT
jgi:hypothetical protein